MWTIFLEHIWFFKEGISLNIGSKWIFRCFRGHENDIIENDHEMKDSKNEEGFNYQEEIVVIINNVQRW